MKAEAPRHNEIVDELLKSLIIGAREMLSTEVSIELVAKITTIDVPEPT